MNNQRLILLFCLVAALSPASAAGAQFDGNTVVIPATDPDIRYTGRWNFAAPSDPWCTWIGSSVQVQFDGTAIAAALDSGNRTEHFRIIVDGDVQNTRKISVAPGQDLYVLANGLTPGIHRIELVRETHTGQRATFSGFVLKGSGTVALPPRPPHRIEFYGDSNLAGHSLEHESNKPSASFKGAFFGYAGIASRMLNAEFHNISRDGETIISMHNKFDRYDYSQENPQWDFNNFQPDLVVVNLGANDVGASKAVIKNRYSAFLTELRSIHPNAHIMLFNAWGWDYDEPANYTHEVITEMGDPNMSSAIFPWVFEQWHGCEYDHGGMAQYLTQHVSNLLGWSVQPTDVMSGYGQNGDVANGSFEEVAPFGGFGWRYVNDLGVKRLLNPAEAHSGDYALALFNGGQVHQPNPANGGQTVTVEVWLRGEFSGDQVTLTVDFRDQEIWTTPLQTYSEIKTLTTDWQKYTISSTAPTGGPLPVFHTRLTMTAGTNSRLLVDSVSMTTQ